MVNSLYNGDHKSECQACISNHDANIFGHHTIVYIQWFSFKYRCPNPEIIVFQNSVNIHQVLSGILLGHPVSILIKQRFVCVCVCLFIPDIFQYNHLLLCHNYPSFSSNFYHHGKTTNNSISYFCVTITKVLVKTFNTRGKYKWRHSSSIPTRTRWRLAPLKFQYNKVFKQQTLFLKTKLIHVLLFEIWVSF